MEQRNGGDVSSARAEPLPETIGLKSRTSIRFFDDALGAIQRTANSVGVFASQSLTRFSSG